MANFAEVPDLVAAWRALTVDETAAASTQLTFASAIIRTQVPTMDARLAAEVAPFVLADLVKGVTVAMVLRRMMNPDGVRSVQEALEDYSRTTTRDAAVSSGGLCLTDEELWLLRGRRKAFSVTPGNEPTTYAIQEQIAVNRARREWDDRRLDCR